MSPNYSSFPHRSSGLSHNDRASGLQPSLASPSSSSTPAMLAAQELIRIMEKPKKLFEVHQALQKKNHRGLDSHNSAGDTPLIHATKYLDGKYVDVLLEYGAKTAIQQDLTGQSALAVAVVGNRIELMTPLLKADRAKNGRTCNLPDHEGRTPLIEAVEQENQTAFDILMAVDHLNVNHADKKGRTALYIATRNNNLLMIARLAAHGADPFIVPLHQPSIVSLLAAQGHTGLLAGVLKQAQQTRKPNLLAQCLEAPTTNLRTPLHDAALNGHADCVQTLLYAGANMHALSSHSSPPLFDALRSGSEPAAGRLIDAYEAGPQDWLAWVLGWVAPVYLEDADHRSQPPAFHSALTLALDKRLFAVAERLIALGADVSDERTTYRPIQIAIAHGQQALVKMLISAAAARDPENGVDRLLNCTHSSSEPGQVSMLDQAIRAGDEEMTELLIGQGASLKLDVTGGSVLHQCARAGQNGLFKLLLKKVGELDNPREIMQSLFLPESGPEYSLLREGVRSRDHDMIDSLVRGCVQLDIDSSVYGPPLRSLARQGKPAVLEFYLQTVKKLAGGDILGEALESRDNEGRTPLLCSAEWDDVDSIKILLAYGASAEAVSNDDDNLLGIMAIGASVDKLRAVIGLLLQEDDRPDTNAEPAGRSSALVQRLLNLPDVDGQTPTMLALRNNPAAFDYLVSQTAPLQMVAASTGADADKLDGNFIHAAVIRNNARAIETGIAAILSSIESPEIKQTVRQQLLNQRDLDGKTPLLLALKSDNVNMLRTLLNQGADPAIADKNGTIVLHLAVQSEHAEEMVPMIMEARRGISKEMLKACQQDMLTAVDNKGQTALLCALDMQTHEATVDLLRNHGASFRGFTEKQFGMALNRTARWGSVDLVRQVLEQAGRSVPASQAQAHVTMLLTHTDSDGLTPVLNSMVDDHQEVTRLLLENGASLKGLSGKAITPVYWAAIHDNLDLLNQYLEIETSDIVDPEEKKRTVHTLINAVARINDQPGMNALTVAASKIHLEVVKRLLDLGAEMAFTLPVKNTHLSIFHLAASLSSTGVLEVLVDELRRRHPDDAEIVIARELNCQTREGVTPLFTAVGTGNRDMIAWLAVRKVDVTHHNQNGSNILHVAAAKTNGTTISQLATIIGARDSALHTTDEPPVLMTMLQQKNSNDLSPLELAIDYKNSSCVMTLTRIIGIENLQIDRYKDWAFCVGVSAHHASPLALGIEFGGILLEVRKPKVSSADIEQLTRLRKLAARGNITGLQEALQKYTEKDLKALVERCYQPIQQKMILGRLTSFRERLKSGEHKIFSTMLMRMNYHPEAEKAFAEAISYKRKDMVDALRPAVNADFLFDQMTSLLDMVFEDDNALSRDISRKLAQSVGSMLLERCKTLDPLRDRQTTKYIDTNRKLKIGQENIAKVIAALVLASIEDIETDVKDLSFVKNLFKFDLEDKKVTGMLDQAINYIRRLDTPSGDTDSEASGGSDTEVFKVLPEVLDDSPKAALSSGPDKWKVDSELLDRLQGSLLTRTMLEAMHPRYRMPGRSGKQIPLR